MSLIFFCFILKITPTLHLIWPGNPTPVNPSLDSHILFFNQTVDQNIRQGLFPAAVLTQANDLTGAFNNAWRKHDFARLVTLPSV